jgi:RNA-directed DNA polymerase
MAPESPRLSLIARCAAATGLTQSEVLSIARTGPKRYKIYQIDKRSGGRRTICHPSRELKALQYFFLREVLVTLPVHENATAYKLGASIRVNAERHKDSRVILKLDFNNFFNSIKVNDWTSYVSSRFSDWTREDIAFSAFVMFWGEGGYQPSCLAVGAPVSPSVSNALMYRFDNTLTDYAKEQNLKYTRYADDITFSSEGFLNKLATIRKVQRTLREIEYPKLTLNQKKTRLASKATMRQVTGLVITNESKISLGREKKRIISAMVNQAINGSLSIETSMRLKGLLAYAQDVEPTFVMSLGRKYGETQLRAVREISSR